MTTRREEATRIAQEAAQMLYEKCMEIVAVYEEVEQADAFTTTSTWNLSVYAKDRELPIVVPDAWIKDWAIYCDGNKDFVIRKVRDLQRWAIDNPTKRKLSRSVRRWLGARIADDWKKLEAGRPASTNSLRGYERRHGGD